MNSKTINKEAAAAFGHQLLKEAMYVKQVRDLNLKKEAEVTIVLAYIEEDYEFVEEILVSLIEKKYSKSIDSLIAQLPQNRGERIV